MKISAHKDGEALANHTNKLLLIAVIGIQKSLICACQGLASAITGDLVISPSLFNTSSIFSLLFFTHASVASYSAVSHSFATILRYSSLQYVAIGFLDMEQPGAMTYLGRIVADSGWVSLELLASFASLIYLN